MSYTVFARKYRPQTFDDVVGQEHITRTLKNAILQNRLAHAYLFVGPRGTGKTSSARILAKALNCLSSPGPTLTPCDQCDSCREITAGNSLDVLEFDAASNTQVDKVREIIIDNVKYLPARGRFKVYLVDEVHMLSSGSFNALLKTLEEPPPHVKFLFATTDVQKLPATILSRCQRFDLKRIGAPVIAGHLLHIAAQEGVHLSEEAALAVAVGADGGMRDAESMLDQLVAFCGGKIEEADVLSVFGFTSRQKVSDLCSAVLAQDASAALALVHEQAEAGRDLTQLLGDLISHLRNLLLVQADPRGLEIELGRPVVESLQLQCQGLERERLLELIDLCAAAEQKMKWASNKQMYLEVAILRAIQAVGQVTLSEVLGALTALREGRPIAERSKLVSTPVSVPAPQPKAVVASSKRLPKEAPFPEPVSAVLKEAPVKEDAHPAPSAREPLTQRLEPAPVSVSPVTAEVVSVGSAPTKLEPEMAFEMGAGSVPAPGKEPLLEPVLAFDAPPSAPAKPAAKRATKPRNESLNEPRNAPDSAPIPPLETTSVAFPAAEPALRVPAPPDEQAPAPVLDVEAVWPQLVEAVRRERPLISMWLEGGVLSDLSGGVARLVFPKEQPLSAEYLLQANNRTFLEDLLKRLVGSVVSVRTELSETVVLRPVAQPPPPPKEAPKDPMEEFKNDPLIRKALEIFKARLEAV